MKSFICILLALFQFTIFTAIGAVGEPPLHELPLNLSLSDAGVRDSTSRMSVVEYKFKPKSLILPASLITVGAIGTAIDGMNDVHLFSRKDSVKKIRIDDYMEWGMLGWVFVCDLMGKEKHNWVDQLCLVVIAEGFNAAMTRTVKYTVGEIRPDGGPHSFPSGILPMLSWGRISLGKNLRTAVRCWPIPAMRWRPLSPVRVYITTVIGWPM